MWANHLIAFDRVSKTFMTKNGENQAVDDISLTVDEGEFVSILGPSGCGKSTLLSMLSGLFQPTKGKVFVNNESVTKPRKDIGYMLQQDYLLSWRTIRQNILLGLEIQNALTSETERHALRLLAEMGLLSYKDHYPHQLSGGMRQRVALVRTLATNPQILLLDEPFSALDFQTKLRLEDLVADTLKRKKKTAILVTHDISEAVAMSDRIFVLKSSPGKIATTIEIPDSLREPLPFASRDVPDFQHYFQLVWKELNTK
ncbi:spermidine/putrescine ABC transporter ATP-binding protein [Ammoniphilus oxalaticus]|uniref:Spermidine/putrescine ABC transporter ATP-binding protein n=1 Tax=Ammoniphilus oxalaticus TaxID=66863 RepID=A0A419SIT2_9BACL|nr:ABC transporter ATP-binding protein [Ammoniphilus oxalaticus]RKD23866.1 spermidine/putrescine ABC transporter ATP-binding protein [Ammoniphilus oxalaticus]